MVSLQGQKIEQKYAPLVGIDQFGSGAETDQLQFWNYGYWQQGVDDPLQASENLFAELASRLPPRPARVLDVGFGQGGSLLRLCDIYGVDNVTGINIAGDQISHARKRGIECELLQMDAAAMTFASESFDAIFCMEAAFHFDSRLDFLKRAERALKPGGSLVMSDLLFRSNVGLDPHVFPAINTVNSDSEYIDAFIKSGFRRGKVKMDDITQYQLVPFCSRMLELAGYLPKPRPSEINIHEEHAQTAIMFILTRLINISKSVIVTATKT